MSLPAKHRLKHPRTFAKVYREGIRRSSQHLVLRALKYSTQGSKFECLNSGQVAFQGNRSTNVVNKPSKVQAAIQSSMTRRSKSSNSGDDRAGEAAPPGYSPTQFGISISQKVSKTAVVRNRIKRQIKAAIRTLLPRTLEGWLVVVVVRTSATRCDYGQFLQELEQMLTDAEVLDGHS